MTSAKTEIEKKNFALKIYIRSTLHPIIMPLELSEFKKKKNRLTTANHTKLAKALHQVPECISRCRCLQNED